MSSAPVSTNIHWHSGAFTPSERFSLLGQRGSVLWFTGLSASGKSTLAVALEQHLLHSGINSYRLDGDNIRFGLNKNLGFSPADRTENIRRIGEVAKLFADSGTVCLASFISPYRADRDGVRELVAAAGLEFVEIFVDCPIDTLIKDRDPKGLYKKAMAGEIKNFTGVSSDAPYEPPLNPELHIRTDQGTIEDSVLQIVKYLESSGKWPKIEKAAA